MFRSNTKNIAKRWQKVNKSTREKPNSSSRGIGEGEDKTWVPRETALGVEHTCRDTVPHSHRDTRSRTALTDTGVAARAPLCLSRHRPHLPAPRPARTASRQRPAACGWPRSALPAVSPAKARAHSRRARTVLPIAGCPAHVCGRRSGHPAPVPTFHLGAGAGRIGRTGRGGAAAGSGGRRSAPATAGPCSCYCRAMPPPRALLRSPGRCRSPWLLGGTQPSPPAPRSPARPRLPPPAPGKGPRPGPGGGGGLGVPPGDGAGGVTPRRCHTRGCHTPGVRTPSHGTVGIRGCPWGAARAGIHRVPVSGREGSSGTRCSRLQNAPCTQDARAGTWWVRALQAPRSSVLDAGAECMAGCWEAAAGCAEFTLVLNEAPRVPLDSMDCYRNWRVCVNICGIRDIQASHLLFF